MIYLACLRLLIEGGHVFPVQNIQLPGVVRVALLSLKGVTATTNASNFVGNHPRNKEFTASRHQAFGRTSDYSKRFGNADAVAIAKLK